MRYLQLSAHRSLIKAIAEAFNADPTTTFVGGGAARHAIDSSWARPGEDIDVFLGATDRLTVPHGWVERPSQGYQTYLSVWENPRYKGIQVIQISHGLLVDEGRRCIESFDIPEHRAGIYLSGTVDLTASALTEFGLCESTVTRVRKALSLTSNEARAALYRAVDTYAADTGLPDHTPVTFLGPGDIRSVPFASEDVALIGHETFVTGTRIYLSRQALFEEQARTFPGDYAAQHCLAGRRWVIDSLSPGHLVLTDPRHYRRLSFSSSGAGWTTQYDAARGAAEWTCPTTLTVSGLLGHPDTRDHTGRWYVLDPASGQLRYEHGDLSATHGGLTLSAEVRAGRVQTVRAEGTFTGTVHDQRPFYRTFGAYLPSWEIEQHFQQAQAAD
ncbi:hypothetical protein [Deinococcus ficus]|uniref:Uncharacterized protein n=1 Tax=Deinococcus ficus TaxID=317577 RepID=A0A221T2Z3_9DEIO|nr:hypothetical protein [Deinococcus ficus]ASN83263.1 hypothetical protein DFI_18875 [Deinococcus ficus]